MPPTSPNANNQLGFGPIFQRIQAMEQQLATFLTTIPIKDNHGNTVVIIGDISTDPQTGKSTGLSGFGIASHMTGSWVQTS